MNSSINLENFGQDHHLPKRTCSTETAIHVAAMKNSEPTKAQLLEQLEAIHKKLRQLESLNPETSENYSPQFSLPSSWTNPAQMQICGLNFAWHPQTGCSLENQPIVMMQINSTLASFMAAVQGMVGTKRFTLALQSEGRNSIESDWQIISKYEDFAQGFAAITAIAKVSGWGDWELLSLNQKERECYFRVKNSWEGRYQTALGVCWGSSMLAGKLAGYCTKVFKTNCWAQQTSFIANGNEYDEFIVRPSNVSVEEEIEQLLMTGEANRADLAVALQRLRREVRDRQRIEAALRHSEQYNRQLFEESPIGLVLFSMEGQIVDVNPAFAAIIGRNVEETLGLYHQDITPEKYTFIDQKIIEMLLKNGRYESYEKEYIHQNGHFVPVRLLGVLIEKSGEKFIWSSVEDITEHKQAELALRESEAAFRKKNTELQTALYELQQAQSQLIQTEKMSSLGQLVAGVAHEINNPVNFIYGNITHARGYTEDLLGLVKLYQKCYPNPLPLIQQEIEEIELNFLSKDLPKLLDSMEMGADRIREIVLSLRNFSRTDEAQKKAVDIHAGIESTLMILQNRLKPKSDRPAIEIVKTYGNIPLVECYPGQLNQVFMNILTNAIDALDEYNEKRSRAENQANPSKIHIGTEIQTGTDQSDQWVVIRIRDNGPGMSEEVRNRLFDPFFTTKPVGIGTGIGLSISYQIIVQKHQGSLECHSVPGSGAEFIIQIPIQQSSSEPGAIATS